MIRTLCPTCRDWQTVRGNKTVRCRRCHSLLYVSSRPLFPLRVKLAVIVPTLGIILFAILRGLK